MSSCAVGVDIGGTKVSVGLVTATGLVADTLQTAPTPANDGPDEIVRLVADMVGRIATDDMPIGVGSAGAIDRDGAVRSATDAIAGWAGVDLSASLARLLGRTPTVLNDVHAAAVGEAALGEGRGCTSFLMVTVGTGVGGAIYRDGRLVIGATGTAGSVGHTAARGYRTVRRCPCGQDAHIEAYASGPALELSYAEASGERLGLREIVRRASEGDAAAAAVLREGAEMLGSGLADALTLVDVERVLIGGGVASIGPGYLGMVAAAFERAAYPGLSTTPILAAGLTTDATLVGAGLHAMNAGTRRS